MCVCVCVCGTMMMMDNDEDDEVDDDNDDNADDDKCRLEMQCIVKRRQGYMANQVIMMDVDDLMA